VGRGGSVLRVIHLQTHCTLPESVKAREQTVPAKGSGGRRELEYRFRFRLRYTYRYRYGYINIYIYMSVYIYIYIHIYLYTYTHIHIYTHTHTHTHIYIYIYIYGCIDLYISIYLSLSIYLSVYTTKLRCPSLASSPSTNPPVGLYKMLFHFKASVHELSIPILPSRPASPTLLQYFCTTIAHIRPPPHPTLRMPCAIQYW